MLFDQVPIGMRNKLKNSVSREKGRETWAFIKIKLGDNGFDRNANWMHRLCYNKHYTLLPLPLHTVSLIAANSYQKATYEKVPDFPILLLYANH